MKQFLLDVAGLSDRGVKREHNEDAWSAPRQNLTPERLVTNGRLYVVADGVGGHVAGDVASKMAVEIIQLRFYAEPVTDVPANLRAAIEAASEEIHTEAAAQPARRGMRTTATAVILRGDELTVANVGDSRTYLIRQGCARQLTTDHTWVQEQVQGGIISREDAKRHAYRNIITRSLGSKQAPKVDIFHENVEPGDWVLLCSDGLSNLVSDQEIGEIVSQEWTAEAATIELVELTKTRGAPDNVTAVLIGVVRPI
jgi:protein phosphatase